MWIGDLHMYAILPDICQSTSQNSHQQFMFFFRGVLSFLILEQGILVQEFVQKNAVEFVRIDGTTSAQDRMKYVNRFQNEFKVMDVNSQATPCLQFKILVVRCSSVAAALSLCSLLCAHLPCTCHVCMCA